MNILFILLQATTTETIPIKPMTHWQVFMTGEWVSYILIGLSIILSFFIIERLWVFLRLLIKGPKNLLQRIQQLLLTRGMESAQEALRNSPSSYSIILRESLEIMMQVSPDNLKERVDEVAQRELTKLERNIGYISLIAGAAPMVGFLGTVVGMIQAFSQLSTQEGATSAKELATGIYQAMGTTMGGLVVGIVAYIAYNLYITVIHRVTGKMDSLIHDFMLMAQRKG